MNFPLNYSSTCSSPDIGLDLIYIQLVKMLFWRQEIHAQFSMGPRDVLRRRVSFKTVVFFCVLFKTVVFFIFYSRRSFFLFFIQDGRFFCFLFEMVVKK